MTGHMPRLRNGLAAAGVFAIANVASAGNNYIGAPYCYKASDGSGYCYGYYKSFLNTPNNQTDSASFSKNMYAWGYVDMSFYAYLNNVSYSCYAPAGSFFAKQTDTIEGKYFYVTWDTSGSCVNVQVSNVSVAF